MTNLLKILQSRFENNLNRHPNIDWSKVQSRLESNPDKLQSLSEMERTGGEPDVVGFDKTSGDYIIYDCSSETPKGRTNICYDHEALEARKKFPPKNSALNMATSIGIEILNEKQYRELQTLGKFDTKTSSWIKTPSEIRQLGGALFCDRRYDHVFVYHNGADSYYATRGFRGCLRV